MSPFWILLELMITEVVVTTGGDNINKPRIRFISSRSAILNCYSQVQILQQTMKSNVVPCELYTPNSAPHWWMAVKFLPPSLEEIWLLWPPDSPSYFTLLSVIHPRLATLNSILVVEMDGNIYIDYTRKILR